MRKRNHVSIFLLGISTIVLLFLAARGSLQELTADEIDAEESELIITSFQSEKRDAMEMYYDRSWENYYISEWCSGTVSFTVNTAVQEELTQVEYKVAGYEDQTELSSGGWSEYSDYQTMEQELKLNPAESGNSGYSVRFRGIYQEEEWESPEYLIRIDQISPEISLQSAQDLELWNREKACLTVLIKDEYVSSGLQEIRILLGKELIINESYIGGGPSSWEKELCIEEESSTPDGHQLLIQVTDQAGNRKELSQSLKIDQTPPEVILDGIIPESYTNQKVQIAVGVKERNLKGTMVEITGERIRNGETEKLVPEKATLSQNHVDKVLTYSEEGYYIIYAVAVDPAGNQSEGRKIAFTIDYTAPVIKVEGVTEGSYYNQSARVRVTIEEAFPEAMNTCVKAEREWRGEKKTAYHTEWKRNGTTSTCDLTFSKDGIYQLEATAEDQAGNSSKRINLTFVIDQTPPELTIKGAEDYQISAKGFEIIYEVQDAIQLSEPVSVEVVWEDMYGNQTEQEVNVPLLEKGTAEKRVLHVEEGIYYINLTAADRAGNSASLEKRIIVDRTSPVIRYMNELDGSYLQSFSLSAKMRDMFRDLTIPSYQMYLNGEPYDGKTVIKKEGAYLLRIEAADEAGNSSQALASFIIDRTPPEVLFEGINAEGIYGIPMELNIRLLNREDFVDTISINGSQKEVKSEADIYQFSFTEEGEYVVVVQASDRAGNKSAEQLTLYGYKNPILHAVPQKIKRTIKSVRLPGVLLFVGILSVSGIILIRKYRKKSA